MGSKLTLLVLGFVVGVAFGVGGAVLYRGSGPAAVGPSPRASDADFLREEIEVRNETIRGLEAELERAKAEVVAARSDSVPDAVIEPTAAEAEEAAPAGPVTLEQIKSAIRRFAGSFQQFMVEGKSKELDDLRALLRRAAPEEIARLIEEFHATTDIGMKTMIAHALGQSGSQAAIDALVATARDTEIGFFERRVASHGLAFSDAEGVDPVLAELARGDAERGVRANAAFGLARRGDDEGIALYAKATDEAFAAKDPVAVQYLYGFLLLGERALPVARERLATYEDRQARLLLIEMVKDRKDRESLPILYEIVNDPAEDTSLKTVARTAIEEIEKE